MKRTVRIIIIAIVGIFFLAGVGLYIFFAGAGVPNNLEKEYLYIPTGSSYEEVVDSLNKHKMIKNESFFRMLSQRMNYVKDPMRAGRYKITPGWSVVKLIRHLRSGPQAPVDVVLTNERLTENVAAKVARFLEQDSLDFWILFQDTAYLKKIGYTQNTLMSLFIPNTYEMYWTTTPKEFIDRMIREHDRFWEQNDRLKKAKALEMTPEEVYTLASIVEKETLHNSEKKRMAGVYLNRLKLNMLLQADPTAVFARRDFNTPRVTHYHTKFDSPYNTYMYLGLPPGPISMASISSIDAILNAEDHDYVYFCAIGDGSGLHSFAETLAGHNQNAAKYRENLRKRGLR